MRDELQVTSFGLIQTPFHFFFLAQGLLFLEATGLHRRSVLPFDRGSVLGSSPASWAVVLAHSTTSTLFVFDSFTILSLNIVG